MPILEPTSNDIQPQSTNGQQPGEPSGDAGIVSEGTQSDIHATDRPVKKHLGGPAYHKPGCKCRPCQARARQAEAIARGDGPAFAAALAAKPREINRKKQAALNADLPHFHIKGRGMRERIAQFIELRTLHPEWKNVQIAKEMGINPSTLSSYITRATNQGWLKFDDPISRLDYEIAPKVLDNLNTYLDQKDRQVTIEAAKGILFPAYKEAKGIIDQGQKNYLAIKFEMPSAQVASQLNGQANLKQVTGTVVGIPKEIIDVEVE